MVVVGVLYDEDGSPVRRVVRGNERKKGKERTPPAEQMHKLATERSEGRFLWVDG